MAAFLRSAICSLNDSNSHLATRSPSRELKGTFFDDRHIVSMDAAVQYLTEHMFLICFSKTY